MIKPIEANTDLEDLAEFNEKISPHDMESEVDWAPSIKDSGREDEIRGDRISNIKLNAKMWASSGTDFFPCEKSVDLLPSGQYTVKESMQSGIYFSRTAANVDTLMSLPDSASEEVIASINNFWTLEDHFRSFGFLWKRGILLWGPPGSGKTSTLQMVSQNIINAGGISLYVTEPGVAAQGLALLRRIEPTRRIVVMIEDIDAIIRYHGEASLLALLDGELQIDNVVFIATTNYPEKLDRRFINRPSRFDIVKKIGMPNAQAREVYLLAKNTRLTGTEELTTWVNKTEGFSIAHLKELIVSVECFNVSFTDALARLRTMMDVMISSDDYGDKKKAIGIR